MVFDIQNMITTIKKIDGINISNEDILGAFFDPIIKCKCLKKNGKYICFDKTRASKVMNHVETIYISLSKTALIAKFTASSHKAPIVTSSLLRFSSC